MLIARVIFVLKAQLRHTIRVKIYSPSIRNGQMMYALLLALACTTGAVQASDNEQEASNKTTDDPTIGVDKSLLPTEHANVDKHHSSPKLKLLTDPFKA